MEPSLRQRLSWRIKAGIGATILSLLALVVAGQMELPLSALTLLMPRPGGCFNPGAIPAVIAFGLGFLMSAALILIGIIGLVMVGLGVRAGLVIAVVINAIVATLLLIPSITWGSAPPDLELFGTLAACALAPAAGIVLLLKPSAFRSSKSFVATVIVAGVLLVPGALGGVALGLELAGVAVTQPAQTQASTSQHAC